MSSKPFEVSLTLERKWSIYAFPVGCTPTDERGIALGAEELGQLVEAQTRGLNALLEEATKALAAAQEELALLREANTARLHDALSGE